ncbi:MAG: hypothetical protein K8U57_09160 [Planctomycetes bacterium]|nr:hypothetical protein [Planctomycetota bacterium]
MRKLAILALLLVAFPTPASESLKDCWREREFKLDENSRRATHVIVVDACGQILDVWKGDAHVGDYIPLDRVLAPAFPRLTDTREIRLTDRIAWSESWLDKPARRERMILFLVKRPAPCTIDPYSRHSTRRGSVIGTPGGIIELGGFQPGDGAFESSEEFFMNSTGGLDPERERRKQLENPFATTATDRVYHLSGAYVPLEFPRGSFRGRKPPPPCEWVECSMLLVNDFGNVVIRGSQDAEEVPFGNFQGRRQAAVPAWRVVGTELSVQRKVWEANNQTRSLD